jgi:pimeloyl-ACP methyl ester carboxylesterase
LRKVRTLVLTGDQDTMIPPEHSELLVEHLGGEGQDRVEYVVVREAGHLVPLEKPAEVTAALSRLLRRVVAELPERAAR